MEQFPQTFVATKIQVDVTMNRMKKMEDDLKVLRKKIVDCFENRTIYHAEITHTLIPDLLPAEQSEFYHMIKQELVDRQFTVRGGVKDGEISMVIFSNKPRTHEMDKILKQYSNSTNISSIYSSSTAASSTTPTTTPTTTTPTTNTTTNTPTTNTTTNTLSNDQSEQKDAIVLPTITNQPRKSAPQQPIPPPIQQSAPPPTKIITSHSAVAKPTSKPIITPTPSPTIPPLQLPTSELSSFTSIYSSSTSTSTTSTPSSSVSTSPIPVLTTTPTTTTPTTSTPTTSTTTPTTSTLTSPKQNPPPPPSSTEIDNDINIDFIQKKLAQATKDRRTIQTTISKKTK